MAAWLRASKALRRAGSDVCGAQPNAKKQAGQFSVVNRGQLLVATPQAHALARLVQAREPVARLHIGKHLCQALLPTLCLGGWHAGLALHFFDRALGNRRAGESPVVGQLQRQRVSRQSGWPQTRG